jgi:hypothetical protein
MGIKPGPALGALTAEEAQLSDVAINFLNRFVSLATTFFYECQDKPLPGSAIARAKQNRDLVLVLDVGLLLDGAGDHLTTVVNQFVLGLLPRFSLYTVIRGALEASAWACWLLDPIIDDSERLGRTLTVRADSLFEMRRLGLKPIGTTPGRHYAKRIKRVLATGKRWKLTPKMHRDGRVAFVVMPKVTPLLRSLLAAKSARNKKLTVGDQTYGELSARAHGTTWALLQSLVEVQTLNEFQKLGYSGIDVVEFIRLLGVVVALHDEAMKRLAILSGREPVEWEARRGDVPWQ